MKIENDVPLYLFLPLADFLSKVMSLVVVEVLPLSFVILFISDDFVI